MAFHVMAAGCGGIVDDASPCETEPIYAGLRYTAHGRTVWLGFACPRHADQLIAARPLLPRDRDVLNRRRDHRRALRVGKRWAGEQEGPLARGAAAERLIGRAQRWAATRSRS